MSKMMVETHGVADILERFSEAIPELERQLRSSVEGQASLTLVRKMDDDVKTLRRFLAAAKPPARPVRMHIYAPDAESPLREMSGTNVLAVANPEGSAVTIFPVSGEVLSLEVPKHVLMFGWAT